MFRIRGWAVPKLRNFHSTSTEDGDPDYADEASTTVHVELNSDNEYEPNEDELYGLESLLFDIDVIQGME